MNGARNSTGIGTTGIDKPPTGRFAPSPTGPLHLGSLVAATGSYVDARARGGRWLVRIEDLDTPRCIPGMSETILRTLEAFGFEWYGKVERQSGRTALYHTALARLQAAGCTYECSCTRRDVASVLLDARAYPGTCRDGPVRSGPTATRFRMPPGCTAFDDRFQGHQQFDGAGIGDVVIRRRDGVFAYHLAVVMDDADQGVDSIVRGSDLLASTPWHLALQAALRLPRPEYGHLPIVVEPDGGKLAKSQRSVPLDTRAAPRQLWQALALLRQEPPRGLAGAPLREIWSWAIACWSPQHLCGLREVRSPA